MKIVINKCYGGFSLSPEAVLHYYSLKGIKGYAFKETYTTQTDRYVPTDVYDEGYVICFSVPNPNDLDIKVLWDHYLTSRPEERADLDLIKTVEELGEKADGPNAELKVVEIPDDVDYYISEYDGIEDIHEQHRSWG